MAEFGSRDGGIGSALRRIADALAGNSGAPLQRNEFRSGDAFDGVDESIERIAEAVESGAGQGAPGGGGTAVTPNITVTASVDDSGGTPAVTVTKTGTQAAPVLSFAFTGLRGADGAPGKDGRDGVDGQPGAPGRDGVDGAPGRDGKDGADGAPGRDGVDGKDGNLANAVLTGFNASQGGKVTANDTVLSAIGKMQHETSWAITADNDYGSIYWRVRDNVLYLCSGTANKIIPANTQVHLCTLPDGIRGTGIVLVPCMAGGTIPGGLMLDFVRGDIAVIFTAQVAVGTRLFVNIATPAS